MKKRTRDLNLKPGSLASLRNYHPKQRQSFFLEWQPDPCRQLFKNLRQERGHLPGDPARQHRARSIDKILPDIARAFELPAFEIVSCPPFDCADLLAEEEVRGDDAEDEGNGGDEEVGGGHEISRSGVDCVGDIGEEQRVKMEKARCVLNN